MPAGTRGGPDPYEDFRVSYAADGGIAMMFKVYDRRWSMLIARCLFWLGAAAATNFYVLRRGPTGTQHRR